MLTDETDSANGFAQTLPYDLIVLYAAVPEPIGSLSDYDEYLRMLLIHELSHVVHLDTVRGVPRFVNRIFGKVVSPNQVQPRWIIEGLAVWLESYFTSGGRVRSALFDMILRAQFLADRFPTLDEITTFTRDYPGGSAPYLYGGRLLDYLSRKHGSEAIAEMSHGYSRRVLPYGINIVVEDVTDQNFVELWAEWVAEERALAEAILSRVEKRGVIEGQKIEGLGESVRTPRFAPNGRLILIDSPRDDDLELVISDGLEKNALKKPEIRLRTSGGESSFTPDGKKVAAVVSDVVARRFRFRDLELIDLDTKRRTRRTEGARLSDPDVSPDGKTIVAVQQNANFTWLATLSFDGEDAPRILLPPKPGVQLFSPRWSPDGARIAFAVMRADGTRSIDVLDVASGYQFSLTRSTALDQSPAWSPDGKYLYFSSDRGDVFNIHRVPATGGKIEQITNVRTGAFEPIVDPTNRTLLFTVGSADGFDLHRLELDRHPALSPEPAPVRPAATATASAVVYPDEKYTPWETLIPKAYLFDFAVSSNGAAGAISINGDDAIGAHSYRLRVGFDSIGRRLGYNVNYTNRQQPTAIGISSSLSTADIPDSYVLRSTENDQRLSIWTLRFGLDLPLGWWDVGSGLNFSYGLELRKSLIAPPTDPFQGEPRLRGDLRLASFNATWYVSTARGFEESLGNSEGRSFDTSLRLHHPLLGSDLRVLEVSSHLTQYLAMPWSAKHVLAARLAAGVSIGDTRDRSVYVLGGLPIRNVLSDAIDGVRFGADVIRGYNPGELQGPSFYLGSAEYRFLVFEVERGVETLPVFADRLHAAVFFDAGDTPNGPPELERIKLGTGVELRLDLVVGYFLPIDLRFGLGHGLSENGITDFYLVIGGSY